MATVKLLQLSFATAAIAFQGSSNDTTSTSQSALVNFIRHGEKPSEGTGLTIDGQHRASYLSRCMAAAGSSALPTSAPTMLTACAVEEGHSTRARDTLAPLASALNLKLSDDCDKSDTDCLVDRLQSMQAGSVMVVAWEHKAIPDLISALNVPHSGDFQKWPHSCDAESWPEPSYLSGSTCYDKIWQVRFSRDSESKDWKADSIRALQEGFGGSASSACAEGLRSDQLMDFQANNSIVLV